MSGFTISAFADEIDSNLTMQMDVLASLGIHHIEMRGVNGKNISEHSTESIREIKKQLDARGFKISAVGSPIGKMDVTQDFEPHFKLFLHVLELAAILGTRYIRIFSFYIPQGQKPEQFRDEVMERMAQMVKAAEKAGIILLHENEMGIYGESAGRCLDILQTINSPNLKAIFDPANFIHANEITFPYAYQLLKDHVIYMHIKDALLEDGAVVPSGEGDGKLPEILTDLYHSGFSGFLSLEPHLASFEGFSQLQREGLNFKHESGGAKIMALAWHALKKILDTLSPTCYR